MADRFQNYYQRDDLWSPDVVTPHGAVADEILDLVPKEAVSILDVGCGNGAISNAIDDRFVIGSDISLSAIQHMSHPACVADIGGMPFADSSFDLVMATDVLEHIPDDQYERACAEISRISRRWILIAVPYRELLDSATVACAACGELYHVHWHQRVYDEQSLGKHWAGIAPVTHWALAGERWIWTSQAVLDLKHAAVGRNYDFPQAVCPKCGTVRGPSSPSSPLEGEFESLHYSLVEAGAINRPPRSEILALFDKQAQHSAVFSRIDSQAHLPIEILPSQLPRRENPEAYSDGPYVTDVRESSFVLVLPSLPKALQCPAVSAAIFDGVEQSYHFVELDGASELPGVRPTRFGYFIRIDSSLHNCPVLTTSAERSVEHVLRSGPASGVNVAQVHQKYSAVTAELEKRRDAAERAAGRMSAAATAAEARINLLLETSERVEHARAAAERCTVEAIEQRDTATRKLQSSDETRARLEWSLRQEKARRTILQERLAAEGIVGRSRLRDLLKRYKRAFVETIDWVTIRRRKHKLKPWPSQVLVLSHMYPRSYNQIGGIFVHEQVKALKRLGVEVHVVSGEPFWITSFSLRRLIWGVREYLRSSPTTVELEGVSVTYFPWFVGTWIPHWAQAWTYSHGLSRIWRKWAKDKSIGVVHAHTSNLDGSAARLAASRTGAKLVVTEHLGPFDVLTNHPIKRRKTRATVRIADRVFAVSTALRQSMIRNLGSAAQKVDVLGNGVDLSTFVPAEPARRNDATQALWIGHHVDVKRVDRLLSAFSRAQLQIPALRLTLLGDGELLEKAKAQVVELQLEEKVTFLPSTDRAGVAKQIQAHDYVVISSETETFGLVALEAMACGKPVLSTACGGPQDLIMGDHLGMVVENSEDGLFVGLVDMFKVAERFDANLIRSHVERVGSWAQVAQSLTETYAAGFDRSN